MNEEISSTRQSTYVEHREHREPKLTSAKAIAFCAVVLLIGAIFWVAGDVLLLIFTGLLFAILLTNLSWWVQRLTKLSYSWSLGIVLCALLAVSVVVVGLFATRIATEADQLFKSLQSTWQSVAERLRQDSWLSQFANLNPMEELKNIKPQFVNRIAGIFSSTLGVFSSVILILFVGIFTAADPELYRRGLLHMVPRNRRQRTKDVFNETGHKLWWWTLGQLFSMSVVGVATGIGLWLLGIPFAATLGLLSGLLTFIPNFGPIISAIPAILLASSDGIMQAVYVVALYVGVQAAESNLLTPLIQQRNVKLPPVVNVGMQILMGVLFGVAGLIVAAPLAVIGMVLTQRFYVEDYLGDDLKESNDDGKSN